MFILCACNIEARRAFCSLQPLRRFDQKKIIFALPYLCTVAFCRLRPCACFMLHASCFAAPFALKRFKGSFQKVLSRFKRSKFSACTFVHFAPLQAVTWQQTRQNAVIRGRGGPPWGVGREAQLSPHRILYFLIPKKFFLKNLLPPIPCLLKFFFWKIPSLLPLYALFFNAKKPLLWFLFLSAYQQDLIEARICSKKRHFSHFLSKDE